MMRGKCVQALLCTMVGVMLSMAVLVAPAFADTSYEVAKTSDQTLSTQVSKKFTGWEHTSQGWVYYNKGKKVVGLQKVNDKLYYFSSRGIMSESDVHRGGATFYVGYDGQIIGAKYNGAYYYDTLKPMTSDDSYDFDTLIWARSIVDGITNADDSYETKLRKAFDWVVGKYYAIHRGFYKYETNWMATYARDHFADNGGDCHSDASAFAYLAAAIGYQVDVCIDGPVDIGHAWAMIGDKVFDPLFDEVHGGGYYDAYTGTYEDNGGERYRIPTYSSRNNTNAPVNQDLLNAGKIGLKKASDGKYYYYQEGKKLEKAWKTVDGKRYYFKEGGAAATTITKINGVYYAFDERGVLQRSAKSGQRVIKLKDEKGTSRQYLVNKNGKVVVGWSKDKTRYANAKGALCAKTWKTINGSHYYFAKNGKCVTGSFKIKGTYYVFNKKGALQKAKKAAKKTMLVSVGGKVYRVDKKGRAVASSTGEWFKGKKMRFDKTGKLLTGIRYIGSQFYAANLKGVYRPKLTEQLNAVKSKGSKASDLRRLLGAPKEELYMPSCNFDGDDGLWIYPHFTVATERSAAVNRLYKERGYHSIDDVIAAEDAARKAAKEAARKAKEEARKAKEEARRAAEEAARKAAEEEARKAAEEADSSGDAGTPDTGDAGSPEAGDAGTPEEGGTYTLQKADPYEKISAIRAR